MRSYLLGFVCLTFIASVLPLETQAQQAAPRPAQAGRADRQVPKPKLAPRANQQRLDLTSRALDGAPPGADKILFTLNELRLDGVTAYTAPDLQGAYTQYLDHTVSLADLYVIAATLEAKYHDDGYVLARVTVPTQKVAADGMARLVVHEGYLDNVSVSGIDDKHTLDLIAGYMRHVTGSGQPLNSRKLERAMFFINDIPGIDAKAHMSPSPTREDTYDIAIDAGRDEFQALASIDNLGTRYLGPLQVTGEAATNNLIGLDERIALQTTMAPDFDNSPELYYVSPAYQQPVFSYGTTIGFFASNDQTKPGEFLRDFDVGGRSQRLSANLTQPIIRSHEGNLSAQLLFEWQNEDNWDNTAFPSTRDRIRVARALINGDFSDEWLGRNAINSGLLVLSQGLDIMGASNADEFTTSRPGAEPDFTKLNIELQRLQGLTTALDLLVGVAGQWSSGQLFSAEEFGLGGARYARGFDNSDALGDDGIAGTIELQWNNESDSKWVRSWQPYAFFDAGRVWNSRDDVFQPRRANLLSAGLGLRLALEGRNDFDIYVAKPLNRDVPAEGDDNPRVLFTLTHRF